MRQQRYQAYLQAFPILLKKDEIQEQYETEQKTVAYWEGDVKHQRNRIRIGLALMLMVICGALMFSLFGVIMPPLFEVIAFPVALVGLTLFSFGLMGIGSSKRALRKHRQLFAELEEQINYINSIPPFAG